MYKVHTLNRYKRKHQLFRKMECLNLTMDAKKAIGESVKEDIAEHKVALEEFNRLTLLNHEGA